MQHRAIIPHGHTADVPLPAHILVVGRVDMVLKKLQQSIRLAFLELCKTRYEARVDVESF